MTKAADEKAVDEKIAELEASQMEMAYTVQAQSDELLNQMNVILSLRREVVALRSGLNGRGPG